MGGQLVRVKITLKLLLLGMCIEVGRLLIIRVDICLVIGMVILDNICK